MSPEMQAKLLRELRGGGAPALPALSPREREILAFIAGGASNKEIARTLEVAESTVKIHVQHILRKLELTSRVQAAVWAIEHGIAARN
jgi:two-component system nitrate/nitrite response regulator NarL